jgi:hypothetical protein
VIFKGKQIQSGWIKDVVDNEVALATSESGWTSASIAQWWLANVFDVQTKDRAQGAYRLLLIDGHSSHVEYEFLAYCLDNKIIPFCLPPHTTHHLQPLDVGIFGPYQSYYGKIMDEECRKSIGYTSINKTSFWGILKRARKLAFTSETIRSAWAKSGLEPFNPRVVLADLPRENTPELRSSSPVGPRTPHSPKSLRKIATKVLKATPDTPTKKLVKKLSSGIEHMIVNNYMLTIDVREREDAFKTKQGANRQRLAGSGPFMGEDLLEMRNQRKAKEQAAAKLSRYTNRQRSTQPPPSPSPEVERSIRVEESNISESQSEAGSCIVVAQG